MSNASFFEIVLLIECVFEARIDNSAISQYFILFYHFVESRIIDTTFSNATVVNKAHTGMLFMLETSLVNMIDMKRYGYRQQIFCKLSSDQPTIIVFIIL